MSFDRATAAAGARRLTANEASIAGLVAAGLANSEIGSELGLARRTVEWHLSRIYRKLGVHSRDELSALLVAAPAATRQRRER